MKIIACLSFLLVLLPAAPAAADAAYDACIDKAGAVMPDLGDCGAAWVEREDKRLNAAWTTLNAAVSAPEWRDAKDALLKEQRSWLAFRDAACAVYEDDRNFGQNGRNLSYPICRAELIITRTKALEAYGEDFEGQ